MAVMENFLDRVQIYQRIFISSFSISVTVPLMLQVSSFSTDVVKKQNKISKSNQINFYDNISENTRY